MFDKKIMIIFSTLIGLITIYVIICLVIFLSQRKLLYHPNENNYLDENKLTHKIEKVFVKSDNKLIGWYHFKDRKYKTLLFFHGNAGNLQNRIYKLNEIAELEVNYLIIAYRGFSGNEGKPTEEGLYNDSMAAKRWLNSNNIDDSNIILYGESLGTAVAVDLGSKFPFAGIILESPFTSMVELSKIYYPYLPVKLLLKDKYNSEKKIKNIKTPILIMHGKRDNIVPFYMGKRLFEIANKPKKFLQVEEDDHMLTFNDNLLSEIKNFINKY